MMEAALVDEELSAELVLDDVALEESTLEAELPPPP
jgi:hypothetical protein